MMQRAERVRKAGYNTHLRLQLPSAPGWRLAASTARMVRGNTGLCKGAKLHASSEVRILTSLSFNLSKRGHLMSNVGYTPLADHVVVLPDEARQTYDKAGLFQIPDRYKQLEACTGIVAEIGDYVDDVVPGMHVLFHKYAGRFIEGTELKVIHVSDILAELKEDDDASGRT